MGEFEIIKARKVGGEWIIQCKLDNEVGEASAWIVQNYVDLCKECDELREKVKQLEADLRGKNPPIWEGWSL